LKRSFDRAELAHRAEVRPERVDDPDKPLRGGSMSAEDVELFFEEYVFTFMFEDVQRELALARLRIPAGNFLAALGLLCYTEVLGGVSRGTLASGQAKKNFEAFLREMGAEHGLLLDKGINVYGDFRCGLAHEGLIKGRESSVVAMFSAPDDNCGIREFPEGGYVFIVEKYFEDFAHAARSLYERLMSSRDPRLPKQLAGRI
jgi:hypothetical protein